MDKEIAIKQQMKGILGEYIVASDVLQLGKVPPWFRQVVQEFMIPQIPGTPPSTLLLDLNAKMAQVAALNRLQIITSTGVTPANFYTMIFMPSGSGKDYPLDLLDRTLMEPFNTEFRRKANEYHKERREEVEKRAAVNFKTKGAQDNYIKQYGPMSIPINIADATPEGLYATRLEMQRANFGGTFVRIGEFADYLVNQKSHMLTAIIEIFEQGNSDPKVIKSDKQTAAIEGVPSNVVMHTSLAGISSGKGEDRLMNYLARGGARRYFVGYPDMRVVIPFGPANIEDWLYEQAEAENQAMVMLPEFQDRVNRVMYHTADSNKWPLAAEADRIIRIYRQYNIFRMRNYTSPQTEGLRASLSSLHRKALKLAGIIAVFEHPDKYVVSKEDVLYAIYQAELYYKHFYKFYRADSQSDVEALYEYFKDSMMQWTTKTELRRLNLVPSAIFTNWINEAAMDCIDMAELEDRTFVIEDYGKNGKRYSLVPNDKFAEWAEVENRKLMRGQR